MSDYVRNLVRRAAGLEPIVAIRPPFQPGFPPDLEPPWTAPAEAAEPQPAPSARTPRMSQTPEGPTRETAVPHVPDRDRETARTPRPPSGLIFRAPATQIPVADGGRGLVQIARQAEPIPPPRREMASPETPGGQPPVVRARPESAARPPPLEAQAQPPMVSPVERPAPVRIEPPAAIAQPQVRAEGPPAATETAAPRLDAPSRVEPAVPHTRESPPAPARAESTSVPLVQPAPVPPRASIRAVPVVSQQAATPADAPTVEVRIGTVEVQASRPPPPRPLPAPRPRGFDEYAHLRGPGW